MACIYSYHIYWYQCIDNSVFLNTDIKVSITPSVYKSNTLLHVVEYTQKIPLKIKKASLKSKNPCYSVSDRRCWYYIELIADHWGVFFFSRIQRKKILFFFVGDTKLISIFNFRFNVIVQYYYCCCTLSLSCFHSKCVFFSLLTSVNPSMASTKRT